MGFLNQFSSYFTAQEKQTELYALWSAIGVNMEKAFLEEQNKVNAEFTDINNFSEDTMRSWLAFFLKKIPYRTSATCQVTVSLNGSYGRTIIPIYERMSTDSGIPYVTMEELSLIEGDERTITAVQGKRVVETGKYSSMIKVQAMNPDLSYLSLKLGGKEIPEVSFQTSYDDLTYMGSWKPDNENGTTYGGTPQLQNQYGTKGQFYTVIADGTAWFEEEGTRLEFETGDLVVFDGNQWQKLSVNNGFQPIQFANTYAIPRNGFFAYYYNNYLYVKVFTGSDVDNPEGQSYELSYIQSDGVQGEIDAGTLKFDSSFKDENDNDVKLKVSNTESSAGVNQPSVGKLGLYLKERLYSTINVSSVPEYTAWFNAQPEVGDCLVLSDYEKWIRNKSETQTVTGIVTVYLVGVDGNPLQPKTINDLLDRLEPYKDIAVVQVEEFETVSQCIEFEYVNSTDDIAFEQYVSSVASQYYNLSYLHSKGKSLFDDLDLTSVLDDVLDNSPYPSTGLTVKGYHFKSVPLTVGAYDIQILAYSGEKPGTGKYELEWVSSESAVPIKETFTEIPVPASENSCLIYDSQGVLRGTHTGDAVSIDLSPYIDPSLGDFVSGKIKCWWGMENEGVLSIGINDGLRKLESVKVTKAG